MPSPTHLHCIFLAISRLPFEWRTLPTYLLVVVMQCIAVTYLFYLIGGLAAFGIGAYVFGLTATAEVKKSLELLGILLKTESDLKRLTKFISIFVNYHSLLKQLSCSLNHRVIVLYYTLNKTLSFLFSRLSRDFVQLFRPIFIMAFSWCTLSICGAMLLVQIEIVQHRHSVFHGFVFTY